MLSPAIAFPPTASTRTRRESAAETTPHGPTTTPTARPCLLRSRRRAPSALSIFAIPASAVAGRFQIGIPVLPDNDSVISF